MPFALSQRAYVTLLLHALKHPASAVSGVFSDGFHTTVLPQTTASAAFHAHTAAGKLKALMTPTTPSGCQVSIILWPGRSLAIVRPCNCRDRPTAKSQMSIIS
jgi:hypothetical protein